jgi:AcrR family transcriptional regulator
MLKGSLYYYINSKESLLVKIFDDSHAEISQITDVALASPGTGLDRLRRFLTDYALWTLSHLKRAGLYSREWRYASDDVRTALIEHSRYYNRTLRSLIVKCQEEGSIPTAIDPRLASLFIWSAFTTLPDWYSPGRDSEAAVADRYVTMALRAAGVGQGQELSPPVTHSVAKRTAPASAHVDKKKS